MSKVVQELRDKKDGLQKRIVDSPTELQERIEQTKKDIETVEQSNKDDEDHLSALTKQISSLKQFGKEMERLLDDQKKASEIREDYKSISKRLKEVVKKRSVCFALGYL